MAPRGRPKKANGPNGGANLGFEAKMWLAADELRGQVDAAEYKHVVLGLVFLKYISDAFEEHRATLAKSYPDEAEDRNPGDDPLVSLEVVEGRGTGEGGLESGGGLSESAFRPSSRSRIQSGPEPVAVLFHAVSTV
jgi:hypothetical protein